MRKYQVFKHGKSIGFYDALTTEQAIKFASQMSTKSGGHKLDDLSAVLINEL